MALTHSFWRFCPLGDVFSSIFVGEQDPDLEITRQKMSDEVFIELEIS